MYILGTFQTAAFAMGPGSSESLDESLKSSLSVCYRSPGLRIISQIQVSRVGVLDVDYKSSFLWEKLGL